MERSGSTRAPVTLPRLLHGGRRRGPWLPLLGLLLGVVLGVAVFDRIIMPFAVRHGTDRTVPDLRGRAIDVARRDLAANGLSVGRVDATADAERLPGTVVEQDPTPGSRVRVGRRVRLLVSSGRRVVEIPDLIGQTYRSAQVALFQLGLAPGEQLSIPSTAPEGTILATRPGRGERAGGDGRVQMLVAGGTRRHIYLMPDLRGLSHDQAEDRFRQTGITLAADANDRVTDQEPSPGTPIRTGQRAQIRSGWWRP